MVSVHFHNMIMTFLVFFITSSYSFIITKRLWLSIVWTTLSALVFSIIFQIWYIWNAWILLWLLTGSLSGYLLCLFYSNRTWKQKLNEWSLLPGIRNELDYWTQIEVAYLLLEIFFFAGGFVLFNTISYYHQFPVGIFFLTTYHAFIIIFTYGINWNTKIIKDYWDNRYDKMHQVYFTFHIIYNLIMLCIFGIVMLA